VNDRTTRKTSNLLGAVIVACGYCVDTGAAELGGFDCLIEPDSVTEISTREEGVVEAIQVDRGDLVKRGQVIAQLESGVETAARELARARIELDAEISEQKVAIEFAARRVNRAKELDEKQAISAFEKDEADTAHQREKLRLRQVYQRQRLAELEYERASRVLENRTLRSPVDGVVVEKLINVGESVENESIIKIAQVDPLSVEVIIPVIHFGEIVAGHIAEVTPRYPGASTYQATVDVVDRVVDAASNTYGVRLKLPNPSYDIPGGVRCDIRFLQN